jgi:IS1 family transposase
MNRLAKATQVRIVSALVQGNSIRATVRMIGAAKNTVTKLLVDLGRACAKYQDRTLRNLPCKLIQCDEIWSFIGAKGKSTSEERKARAWRDIWTWVAIDSETKLVPSFMLGSRGAQTAKALMDDLVSRLANRVQLTTDGHRVYLNAVEEAFGSNIDYAMLVKIYGNDSEAEARYIPAERIGCARMKMHRFTKLTNASSKKVENHLWAIALHYMHYNFCRVHRTIRVTPAMEAGIADHVWTVEELVALLDSN